jgi:hypothetical protein
MPSTHLARLPAAFGVKLTQLRQQHRDLLDASEQLAAMYIRFCRLYYEVSQDAAALSPDQRASALAALEADFTHVDKSIRSKWRIIGQHADRLLAKPIAKALPPTRDALYELAKADPTKLSRLVAKGTLTPDLSVAQVRSLVTPQRRKPSLQQFATITLSFRSYDAAAKCLASVMTNDTLQRVAAKPAFMSALKAELGDDFRTIAPRFAQ